MKELDNNPIGNVNTYSTTETVVGTYLGQPLYRIIVDSTSQSSILGGYSYDMTSLGATQVTSVTEIVIVPSTGNIQFLLRNVNFNTTTKIVNGQAGSISTTVPIGTPNKLIIEYIK